MIYYTILAYKNKILFPANETVKNFTFAYSKLSELTKLI